jgi:hypothetical protein
MSILLLVPISGRVPPFFFTVLLSTTTEGDKGQSDSTKGLAKLGRARFSVLKACTGPRWIRDGDERSATSPTFQNLQLNYSI